MLDETYEEFVAVRSWRGFEWADGMMMYRRLCRVPPGLLNGAQSRYRRATGDSCCLIDAVPDLRDHRTRKMVYAQLAEGDGSRRIHRSDEGCWVLASDDTHEQWHVDQADALVTWALDVAGDDDPPEHMTKG